MKIKTQDLTGPALRWATAVALKEKPHIPAWAEVPTIYLMGATGMLRPERFAPDTNWSQGGPIIEREEISTEHKFFPRGWEARNGVNAFARGPTPLIAAMRCFVASKLGDEVDVPEESL